MKNPLIETVENVFQQLGISGARLVRESYNSKNFGNAEAVYELGSLSLSFMRDRGQDLLSISSVGSSSKPYPFPDVSLMLGWQNLDEVLNVAMPIKLKEALGYIRDNLTSLEEAFSDHEISSTDAKIKEVQKRRTQAMFG